MFDKTGRIEQLTAVLAEKLGLTKSKKKRLPDRASLQG